MATTMLIAPQLMNNGKCCLAHWNGEELVVLELSPRQRRAFGIEPGTMRQELDPQQESPGLPTIRQVNLMDVDIKDQQCFDMRKPLRGTFTYEADPIARIPITRCALRVKHFRPRMPARVTSYSHRDLGMPCGNLPFSFAPLAADDEPDPLAGPVVLFFQLVTAQSWSGSIPGQRYDDIQRISNILTRVVEIDSDEQGKGRKMQANE